MEPDDYQARWLAQDRKIDEILQINRRLELRAHLAGPRSWMRWFRFGALLEMLLGIWCAYLNGSFIAHHFFEARFVVPAVALQLWFAGVIGTAISRYVRAGLIDYAAPVVTIQRQFETLRVFVLRSLRILFATGAVVWGAPIAIVWGRAIGIDLYAIVGVPMLLAVVLVSAAFGVFVIGVCLLCSRLWRNSAWLRACSGALSGHSLHAAQKQLQRLHAFEQEA